MDTNVTRYIPKRVLQHIVDCYKDADGYWAVCETGYHFTSTGCHTAHGETVREFKYDVREIERVSSDWE